MGDHRSDESPYYLVSNRANFWALVLFLIFINYIADSLSSSVRLFADDCLLYREIKSKEDEMLLQYDLD